MRKAMKCIMLLLLFVMLFAAGAASATTLKDSAAQHTGKKIGMQTAEPTEVPATVPFCYGRIYLLSDIDIVLNGEEIDLSSAAFFVKLASDGMNTAVLLGMTHPEIEPIELRGYTDEGTLTYQYIGMERPIRVDADELAVIRSGSNGENAYLDAFVPGDEQRALQDAVMSDLPGLMGILSRVSGEQIRLHDFRGDNKGATPVSAYISDWSEEDTAFVLAAFENVMKASPALQEYFFSLLDAAQIPYGESIEQMISELMSLSPTMRFEMYTSTMSGCTQDAYTLRLIVNEEELMCIDAEWVRGLDDIETVSFLLESGDHIRARADVKIDVNVLYGDQDIPIDLFASVELPEMSLAVSACLTAADRYIENMSAAEYLGMTDLTEADAIPYTDEYDTEVSETAAKLMTDALIGLYPALGSYRDPVNMLFLNLYTD